MAFNKFWLWLSFGVSLTLNLSKLVIPLPTQARAGKGWLTQTPTRARARVLTIIKNINVVVYSGLDSVLSPRKITVSWKFLSQVNIWAVFVKQNWVVPRRAPGDPRGGGPWGFLWGSLGGPRGREYAGVLREVLGGTWVSVLEDARGTTKLT